MSTGKVDSSTLRWLEVRGQKQVSKLSWPLKGEGWEEKEAKEEPRGRCHFEVKEVNVGFTLCLSVTVHFAGEFCEN